MADSGIEATVRAFEQRLSGVTQGVESCLDEFVSVTDEHVRYLLAERLPSLGSAALPSLVGIINSTQVGSGLRYMAAWVALALGDRDAAVSALCEEVDSDNEWSLPAANALARASVRVAEPSILRGLQRVEPYETGAVLQWTHALRLVGGSLPNDVRERLTAAVEPWAAQAIRKDFPV